MDYSSVAGRYRAEFPNPPQMVPAGKVDVSGNGRWRIWEYAGTKIDAPILGNGDMLAAFAGDCRYPQFWLTTNDFWQMESNPNYEFFHDNDVAKRDPPVALGSPRPLGRIVFDLPDWADAEYSAWQEYADATTFARFARGDGAYLQIKSWVAATENEMFVEFSSDAAFETSAELFFPNELGKGCDVGVDCMGDCEDDEHLVGTFKGLVGGRPLQVRNEKKGVLWGWREFSEKVDVPTKLAFAARFLGRESLHVAYRPGETLTFVVALRSQDKTARSVEYARSRARWITEGEIRDLRAQHECWWRDYWNTSGIVVEDDLLMNAYLVSQYMLGSLSRDPSFPPNILGISTFDRMAWNGNYKINYNHQTPYLGLLAGGHFAQSDPHDQPYLDMLDIGREMSRRLLGHEGVLLPLGLGPKGMVSEALLLHMKSPAVHGALNMMMRWHLSMDRAYLRRVYPFMKAVATFWENDLVERDGVYHVLDGMHERITRDILENGQPEDPSNTLGYLKSFFADMIEASAFLGVDEDKRETWRDMAERLAPYPVGRIEEIRKNPTLWNEGKRTIHDLLPEELQRIPVYFVEGKGCLWSLNFPANVMQIYPAGSIGLDSPPEEAEIARNTIRVLSEMEHANALADETGSEVRPRGAWNATNLGCLFFPAAVRVGYDPSLILKEMRNKLSRSGMPNGFVDGNPHGIENLSMVPNTLQEMMLISHQRILHVFRVWPKELKNAQFFNLRAYGGFIVSASLKDGVVEKISVTSTAGGTLKVDNPWKDGRAMVNGKPCAGDLLVMETVPGGIYEFEKRK